MKLEFTLFDDKRNALGGAQLTLFLMPKSGRERTLGPTDANVRGEVRFEDVDPAFFKRIEFSKSGYVINYRGKATPRLPLGKPHRVSDGHFRFVLIAGEFSPIGDTPKTETDPQKDDPERPDPTIAEPRDETGHIKGYVLHANGQPAPGLIVIAFDRDIGEEKALGEAQSGKEGEYAIRYSMKDLIDPAKGRADLIMRVFEKRASDVPLASSPLIVAAPPEQVINLSIDEEPFRGISLLEQVEKVLADALRGKDPESLQTQDIHLLVERTGLDAGVVAAYVQARQLAKILGNTKNSDLRSFLFALLHSGVSPHPQSLTGLDKTRMIQVLENARQQNWIPQTDIEALQTVFAGLRAKWVTEQNGTLNETLKLAGLNKAQQERASEFLLSSPALDDSAWEDLGRQQGFNAKLAERLRKTIEIVQVLGGEPAALTAARKKTQIEKPSDLTRLGLDDWQDLIKTGALKVPAGFEEGSESEPGIQYARELSGRVEAAFPSAHFVERWLKDRKLPQKDVADFFRHNSDFDFGRESVRERLNASGTVSEEATQVLTRIESLYHLSPDVDRINVVRTLWDNGVQSATDIIRLGRPGVRERFGPALGSNQAADALLNRAAFQTAGDITRRLAISPQVNGIATRVLPSLAAQIASNNELSSLYEQLYGAYGRHHCSHCQSALSPAAYLVDLLTFVDRASDGKGKTGRAELAKRRPEVEMIALSCTNSNALLPHIDLVLEILEQAVAPQRNFSPQSGDKPDVNASKPQNVNTGAYEELIEKDYPWILPFNLDLELSRAYLHQAGVPRYKLVQTLSGDEKLAAYFAAAEYLGLSPRQAELVSSPASGLKLAQLWGFNTLADLIGANSVERVMEKSGLGFSEIKALFNSEFVNPQGINVITDEGGFHQLDAAMLDRAHRMGRLAYHTGYSLADLDLMLNVATNDHMLFGPDLASIAYLDREAGISPADVAGWWTFPAAERPRLFALALGYDENTADQFARLQSSIWESPIVSKDVFDQIEVLKSTGFDVAWAYELLASPELTLTYNAEQIDKWLTVIRESLSVIIDPPQVDGDSKDDEVTITLSDGSTHVVSASLARRMETAIGALAGELAVDPALLGVLLDGTQNSAPITILELLEHPAIRHGDTSDDDIRAALSRLAKQARLFTDLVIDPSQLDSVVNASEGIGFLNPALLPDGKQSDSVLPLTPLIRLIDYVQLDGQWFQAPNTVFKFLEGVKGNDRLTKLQQELVSQTTWSEDDLSFIFSAQGFAWQDLDVFIERDGLLHIGRALGIAAQLQVSAQVAWSFVNPAEQTVLEENLSARYGEATWNSVCRQIHDPLREKRRDALLAWLLEYRRNGNLRQFRQTTDVYAHYLIDPEINACFMTSRIVQANASLQQFAQRILLGLEEPLRFHQQDRDEWEWRRNYRVWEANRKVFLYPENWLEPELRHDKTELFEQLESRLLQDEVTDETAVQALLEYTRGLHSISRLEMVSLCEDAESGTTYVIGRTYGLPHQYYECRRNSSGSWSGWRKIDADIEGDHLLSAVLNRKLYLFWPIFIEQYEKVYGVDIKYYEIKMAWSRLEANGWSAKKISVTSLDENRFRQPSSITFETELSGSGDLLIIADPGLLGYYCVSSGICFRKVGIFTLDLCKDEVNSLGMSDLKIKGTRRLQSGFRENQKSVIGVEQVTLLEGNLNSPTSISLLEKFQGEKAKLLTPWYSEFQSNYKLQPFILEDGKSVYLVEVNSTKGLKRHPFAFDRQIEFERFSGPQDFRLSSDLKTRTGDYKLLSLSSVSPEISVFTGNSLAGGVIKMETKKQSTGDLSAGKIDAKKGMFGEIDLSGGRDIILIPELILPDRIGELEVPLPETNSYLFRSLYHPYTCLFVRQLVRHGLSGLYIPDPNLDKDSEDLFRQLTPHSKYHFGNIYSPDTSVETPFPVENIDFQRSHPYGIYNVELFHDAPILIASRLMRNRQFEQARNWLHFVFDPTSTDGEGPARFWRFRPFYNEVHRLLSGDSDILFGNPENLGLQLETWQADAFNPHAIARLRMLASMRYVIMLYLDNLIAWGDYLFRQDTRESINEAAQLYVMAAEILGPKPVQLDELEKAEPPTAQDLLNAPVTAPLPLPGVEYMDQVNDPAAMSFISGLFAFCLPANDKLLGYWDTVADRLFKLRNCMNIDGITRSLPLFQPPIDPALLVRAKAAGVSIQSVVASLSSAGAGRRLYRFGYLMQRAMDLVNEVRSFGGTLLSTLEKFDAEALANLRSTHQVGLAREILEIRREQLKEVRQGLEILEERKKAVEYRKDYYVSLQEEGLLDEEEEEQRRLLLAHRYQVSARISETLASVLFAFPDIESPSPPGNTIPKFVYGGIHMGGAARAIAAGLQLGGTENAYQAGKNARTASQNRRAQEWKFQEENAIKELAQIEKEMIAIEIRIALSERELNSQETQLANAQQEAEFLRGKFTNEALYQWMSGQLSSLYFQLYQMAFEAAQSAEAAYRFETGNDDAVYVQFGHWNSMKKGLLAGEQLSLDLRRMDASYQEQNKRDYELTKHISLNIIDPLALIRLRETGKTEFHLPEALFDMDFPGHYMRRIKSVSVSIPCITGPYGGVHATLRLEQSRIRCKADLINENYLPEEDDARFLALNTATRAMATSSGQNDSGVFELNFRDERYLPFEGEGVESQWTLSISKEFASFDMDSISDVVLHLHYTARDGGDLLKEAAIEALNEMQNGLMKIDGEPKPHTRLFSVRHDFPNEWARFRSQSTADGGSFSLVLNLRQEHYPFWSLGRLNSVTGLSMFARSKSVPVPDTVEVFDRADRSDSGTKKDTLNKDSDLGDLLVGELTNIELSQPVGELSLFFDNNELSDIWLAVAWSG